MRIHFKERALSYNKFARLNIFDITIIFPHNIEELKGSYMEVIEIKNFRYRFRHSHLPKRLNFCDFIIYRLFLKMIRSITIKYLISSVTLVVITVFFLNKIFTFGFANEKNRGVYDIFGILFFICLCYRTCTCEDSLWVYGYIQHSHFIVKPQMEALTSS